ARRRTFGFRSLSRLETLASRAVRVGLIVPCWSSYPHDDTTGGRAVNTIEGWSSGRARGPLLLHADIERIAETVAHSVDAEHAEENERARKNGEPGFRHHRGFRILKHIAPGRRGGLDADPKKGQDGFGNDR